MSTDDGQIEPGDYRSDARIGHEAKDILLHDRLIDIRDARRAVRTAAYESQSDVRSGVKSQGRANRDYLGALQALLHELRAYAETDDRSLAMWGGGEDPIAVVMAPVPPESSPVWSEAEDAYGKSPRYTDLEPRPVYEVYGLIDVLRMPETFHQTFEYFEKERLGGYIGHRATISLAPQRQVLERSRELINEFLRHVNLDIDVEELQTKGRKFSDYSE